MAGWGFGKRAIDKIEFKEEIALPTFPERGKQTHDSVRKLELEQNLTINCKDIIKRQMANGRELKVTTKSPEKI